VHSAASIWKELAKFYHEVWGGLFEGFATFGFGKLFIIGVSATCA